MVQLLRQPEFQIFLFCLLFTLINWPFLAISANGGVTTLFVYLFTVWGLFIFLLFLIQATFKREGGNDGDDGGG